MNKNEIENRQTFSDTAYTYCKVNGSPLLGALVEGGMSRLRIGWDEDLTLTPGLHSKDPDLDPAEPNQVGINLVYNIYSLTFTNKSFIQNVQNTYYLVTLNGVFITEILILFPQYMNKH